MRINHNIGALNTYRQLTTNSEKGAKSIEKLSSGLRINRAGDDAAGLAISEKMRAQIRGLDQASRNAQDGISMIQTTEGALSETHSILQRMRELANQSASDTNVGVDRAEIQKEMNQLTSEINRIGNTTEFNTQSLLKGKTGTVTATDSATTTITAGVEGVLTGEIANFTTVNNSVVGKTSTTTVQASTSKATGAFNDVAETAVSTKGVKSTVGISNGISFEADTVGATMNNKTVTMLQSAAAGASASTLTVSGGNYTFTIGTDASGVSLATDRDSYYNQIKAAIDDYAINGNAGAGFAAGESITVKPPTTNAALTSFNNTTATFGGGVTEAPGTYTLDIKTAFSEAGDTVKIAGKTFTAVYGTAVAAKGEFSIGASASAITGGAAQVTDLLAAVQADADISARFTVTNGTAGRLTFTEKAGQATGVALGNTTVAGAGSDDKLVIKNGNGNNLRSVTIDVAKGIGTAAGSATIVGGTASLTITGKLTDGTSSNGVKITVAAGGAGDPTASYSNGTLSIALSTAGGNNTLAKIQAAITGITSKQDGIDFSGWTATGAGWDAATETASTIAVKTVTVAGGVDSPTLTRPAEAATALLRGASATADKLLITATTADGSKANGVRIALEAGTGASPTAAYKDGKLTITLAAAASVANNTATNIQAAIRTIGTKDGIDFGNWSTAGSTGTWAAGGQLASTVIDSDQMAQGGANAQTPGSMSVEVSNGNLKIHLANDYASENTAAKIQAAFDNLATSGPIGYWEAGQHKVIDLSKFTFEAQGNWDTNTLGNSIAQKSGIFSGGTEDVRGNYSFDITKAFGEGDQVILKGQTFTAVKGLADATKGQFSIDGNGLGTGTLSEQTTSLLDAVSLNATLAGTYNASIVSGSTNKIQLTEKVSTGKDLKTTDLDTKATGTLGHFAISSAPVNYDGGSFIIDGVEIKISNKEANVGYANGTVIKEAATVLEQNKALVDAINKNDALKGKYTATINADGDMDLVQTNGSETGPKVQAKTSPKGDFNATFQVGANSGQSMTIEVKDMRANALNISGDGSVTTVQAKNGAVASFVAVANVGNGSTKDLTEFALDVSTSEKASAAISVINDAIEIVSGQRSQLGAYQNRLEHTINNLGTSSENLTAAESRIRDVDMAKEIMENTKNNILAQAAQAMLAQANQSTQGVLQLLR